jgi:dihydroxyacetone kinase-like protein
MDGAAWILRFAELVNADADRLTRLDADIGDGDHGTNLSRGLTAAVAVVPGEDTGPALVAAGRALVSAVGGASGPLYGGALRRAGKAFDTAAADGGTADAVGAALRAALGSIQELGQAVEGDKTMVDAFAPAVAAYSSERRRGGDLAACARAAADAAEKGARDTVPLRARKGRASYLGERSVGHLDPGAASTVLLFRALADSVTG